MSEGPISEIPQSQPNPEVQKPSIAQASKDWLQARVDRFNRTSDKLPKAITSKANEYTMYVAGLMGGGIAALQGNAESAFLLSASYLGMGQVIRHIREKYPPTP